MAARLCGALMAPEVYRIVGRCGDIYTQTLRISRVQVDEIVVNGKQAKKTLVKKMRPRTARLSE
jgi:hypothetical protein